MSLDKFQIQHLEEWKSYQKRLENDEINAGEYPGMGRDQDTQRIKDAKKARLESIQILINLIERHAS